MRRMRIFILVALMALFFLPAACDSGNSEGSDNESSSAQTNEQEHEQEAESAEPGEQMAEHHAGEHTGSGGLAMVEVSAEGTELDPPVAPEQIPDGAWMCEMGTVHYAAMERPADSRCPICGMRLTQKGVE